MGDDRAWDGWMGRSWLVQHTGVNDPTDCPDHQIRVLALYEMSTVRHVCERAVGNPACEGAHHFHSHLLPLRMTHSGFARSSNASGRRLKSYRVDLARHENGDGDVRNRRERMELSVVGERIQKPTAETTEEARSASQVNPVPPTRENLVMKPILIVYRGRDARGRVFY